MYYSSKIFNAVYFYIVATFTFYFSFCADFGGPCGNLNSARANSSAIASDFVEKFDPVADSKNNY